MTYILVLYAYDYQFEILVIMLLYGMLKEVTTFNFIKAIFIQIIYYTANNKTPVSTEVKSWEEISSK